MDYYWWSFANRQTWSGNKIYLDLVCIINYFTHNCCINDLVFFICSRRSVSKSWILKCFFIANFYVNLHAVCIIFLVYLLLQELSVCSSIFNNYFEELIYGWLLFFRYRGTGSKCVDTYVYSCATGLGPEKLWIGMVDQDAGCGNVEKSHQYWKLPTNKKNFKNTWIKWCKQQNKSI